MSKLKFEIGDQVSYELDQNKYVSKVTAISHEPGITTPLYTLDNGASIPEELLTKFVGK